MKCKWISISNAAVTATRETYAYIQCTMYMIDRHVEVWPGVGMWSSQKFPHCTVYCQTHILELVQVPIEMETRKEKHDKKKGRSGCQVQ